MSPSANVAKPFLRRTYSRWQKLHTWHTWVLVCAGGAGLTFCFNIALIILASASGLKDGVGTIKKGDCRDIKKSELWLHLGINVLSTMLLGGSNYTMQCLTAPAREEINKSHRSRVSLDIGILSLKKLMRASKRKVILWGFLAVSSVPLHLLYNSAVFSTLCTHSFDVYVVSDDFVSDTDIWVSEGEITDIHNSVISSMKVPSQTNWQIMTNKECLEAYGTKFVSGRSLLLAISSATHSVLEIVKIEAFLSAKGSSTEDLTFKQDAEGFITIDGYSIDYCLSKLEDETCQLEFSIIIMAIVIICNFVKALCMILTVRSCFATPLLNLGDAIESFLKKPDSFTANNCLSNKRRYQGGNRLLQSRIYSGDIIIQDELQDLVARRNPSNDGNSLRLKGYRGCISRFLGGLPFNEQNRREVKVGNSIVNDDGSSDLEGWEQTITEWRPKRHFWFSAANRGLWLVYMSLSISIIGLISILIIVIAHYGPWEGMGLLELFLQGYGEIRQETLIYKHYSHLSPGDNRYPSGSFISVALLANLPQTFVSFLYLTYNALLTCMLAGKEWDGFARKRQTLRVTNPVGNQQSTYWLQLPYKYSIPLLMASAGLHWLMSQTIFFVRIEAPESELVLLACGYSPIAIITILPVCVILASAIVWSGFRRYGKGMLPDGTSSAVISAACHPPVEDVDAEVWPVMWGAITTENLVIGHCCITSFEVSPPVEGKMYACRDVVMTRKPTEARGVSFGGGTSQPRKHFLK